MVVDSSAIVAILLDEPEKLEFLRALSSADDPVVSTVSIVECSLVMFRRLRRDGLRRLDAALSANGIRSVPVDLRQAHAARSAWIRFGRGNSPARLNFGDCFSYALAHTLGRPLLFKGGDFLRTDVAVAG